MIDLIEIFKNPKRLQFHTEMNPTLKILGDIFTEPNFVLIGTVFNSSIAVSLKWPARQKDKDPSYTNIK